RDEPTPQSSHLETPPHMPGVSSTAKPAAPQLDPADATVAAEESVESNETVAAVDATIAVPADSRVAGIDATQPSREDARSTSASAPAERRGTRDPALAAGGQLGRYILLNRLGAGGMGVVWAAYDPELDRKVALKLLHPRAGEVGNSLASQRLVREAQAMARLTHPHVITVYDAGVSGSRV